MFIAITLIPETFAEAQKKMHKIVNDKQAYAYSTDNDNHATELSIHCTKYFQAKTKDKDKTKQDISNKILYEDAQELHFSGIEYNSSSMCTLINILF